MDTRLFLAAIDDNKMPPKKTARVDQMTKLNFCSESSVHTPSKKITKVYNGRVSKVNTKISGTSSSQYMNNMMDCLMMSACSPEKG